MDNMDWTDYYDRNKLADSAENMVNQIIIEIHTKKLPVHSEYNITPKELGMLYRWPLYVGVNTFMERLIRTLYNFDKGQKGCYDGGKYKPVYYNNIGSACSVYYNNVYFNTLLLNNLADVFSENIDIEQKEINLQENAHQTNTTIIHKRQYTLKSAINFLKRNLIHAYLSWTKVHRMSPIAYEDSKWLNMIFSINQRIIELPYKYLSVDSKARGKIKECCNNVFLNNTVYFDEKIENNKIL